MIFLLQSFCPQRHMLFGTFYDSERATSAQARQELGGIMRALQIEKCGICESAELTMEEEDTGCKTMQEAAGAINAKVQEQARLREGYYAPPLPIPTPDNPLFRGAGGKYDDESEALCRRLQASGVLLIVVNGPRGNGISFSCVDPAFQSIVPQLLRETAAMIEANKS